MLTQNQVLQNRYFLKQPLGNHAGRQTWLAADQQTETIVVVKLLAFSPQMQWDALRLFEREAAVLQQLNHPRIPRYLDYFSIDKKDGGGLCWFGLVQEYIPGASLQQRLQQGERFNSTQIQEIATQILEILLYLHGLEPPVLHRDIKPGNLILNETGQVYLVDFGSVQHQAAIEGVTFTIVGTTGYTPLEQFWGRATPASDLYALGATLIHLITGIAPADLPQRNLRIQFRDRISLDPAFVAWIEALVEPDLELRYPSAQQALTDLRARQSLHYPFQRVPPPVGRRIKLLRSPQQLNLEIQGWKQLPFLPLDFAIFGIKGLLALSSLFSQGLIVAGLLASTIAILISTFWIGAEMLIWLLFGMWFAFIGYQCMKALNQELAGVRTDLKRSPSPFLAFGTHRLQLDKTRLTITWKILGFTVRNLAAQTANITEISGDRGTLTIETVETAHQLGYRLSSAESKWLVREIRDWLNYQGSRENDKG
ncbi:serine/threonine protein kinase [Kovacikia minuta CCNUW1]|uniref:serine/threonine protein kinase n=1 Tax=Kovacikia minuta TaxID=2931930 RepID=UPI001CCC6669|nr:serine/threonine-protein kinase [Kovacikia minuta]UBF29099.1 serine/threonine protein kinase [Kovacikia minuta CCNUW1]